MMTGHIRIQTMNKIRTILLSLLISAVGTSNASAADQWTYADNETLYSNMMDYISSSFMPAFYGEPVYFQLQQFVIELEAAHLKDQYAWMGQTHRFCNVLEGLYPPAVEHNAVLAADRYQRLRKCIVMLRDYPMHQLTFKSEEDGNITPPGAQVTAFHEANRQSLQSRRDAFLAFLQSPRPTDGSVQIAKLYSSGFVFRTANVCVGLDINYEEGTYDGVRRSELTGQLDALFITHAHGDHYDKVLMTDMLKADKPVVMPKDIVPDAPSASKVIWDKEVSAFVQIMPLVQAQAGMGAQGTEPCLLYLIEIDGWTLCAVGDNSHTDLESFYHGRPMPDIVALPIFQGVSQINTHLHQASNPHGVTPIYLTAHENEWHHTINGRVSYKYFYSDVYNSLNPEAMHTVVMDNGEHLTLSK